MFAPVKNDPLPEKRLGSIYPSSSLENLSDAQQPMVQIIFYFSCT